MAKPNPKPTTDCSRRPFLLRPLVMRGFRRKHRWLVRLVLLLPCLLLIAAVLVTQTAITRSLVMDRLSKALNVDASAEATRLRLNGDLVIDRLKLRAPGLGGPAGQILSITRVVADIDWWSAVRGSAKIRGLRLVEPVATVSQSMDDQKLNIESLTLPRASPSGGGVLPSITLQRAGIELGEHDNAGAYTLLKHVTMDGTFRPAVGKSGEYEFVLHESGPKTRRSGAAAGGENEGGFAIVGNLASGRVEVEMTNFSLDDWQAASVPKAARKIFQELDLQGSVPQAKFVWTKADGPQAKLELSGVAMYLPLGPDSHIPERPELEPQGPPTRLMRMHGVNGEITFEHERVLAKVTGIVEDLPYNVEVQYEGLDENSPFRVDFESRGFRVERNPDLLPYAPQAVRDWLQIFSSPTATVSTSVTVRRLPPVGGQPGPIRVNGELDLKDGTAAYSKFPYEFRDLDGHFTFDNDTVRVVKVTGRSASGAELLASGTISPLDDTAEVKIDVDVAHAPIDEAMEAAFGPGRGQLIPSLFNKKRYDELVEAGLVQPRAEAERASSELEAAKKEVVGAGPDKAPALNAHIAELESRLRIPAFDFRGEADVSVKVHSPRGKGAEYQTYIDIKIPSVGLLPEKFPLPIEAADVEVIVENNKGKLVSGEFRAVGGGTADVAAAFNVPTGKSADASPDIAIAAREMPLNGLLLHALPGDDPAPGGGGSTVKRILRDLGLKGVGSGVVKITNRGDGPGAALGFDADFKLADGWARPAPHAGAEALEIAGVAGTVKVSESALHAELQGVPRQPGQQKAVATGQLKATIDATFGEGQAASDYTANINVPGLSMSAPVESIVSVFSADAADRLARLRHDHHPEGAVDIKARVAASEGRPQIRVGLGITGDLSFEALGQRANLGKTTGSLALIAAANGDASLECSGLSVPLSFGGEPSGKLSLDGRYTLSGAEPGDPEGEGLRVGLLGGRFESALVKRLLPEVLGAGPAADYAAYSPRGLFDLEASVLAPAEASARPQLRGRIAPRSLELDAEGVPVALEQMGGSIEFEPGSGQIRRLTGRAQDWSFQVSGLWDVGADGTVTVRSQISGAATRLCPDLRAVLPRELQRAMDSLELHVAGPLSLEDAEIAMVRAPATEDDRTNFSGTLMLSKANLDAGVSLTDMSGRVEASFGQAGGDGAPEFRLNIDADSLKIAGVSVANARATVESGDAPGRIIIDEATGECYGGRVVASGKIGPDRSMPGSPRKFEVQGRVSGVRFNPFLQELSSQIKPEGDARPAVPDEGAAEDNSRGLLDAEFTLAGVVGRPETRRGRGSMRVSGGRVLSFPFMTRLIEVSNLALPGNSRLDFATGDFYIDGGLIAFNDLAVRSKTVQILGSGTMTWPGQILDLRFNTWASRPIPVLSALVRNIRDEIVSITVRGKLGEQEVRLQQFPGTRRMLGRSSAPSESDQSRRVTDLYQRTRAGQAIRPSSGGAGAAGVQTGIKPN